MEEDRKVSSIWSGATRMAATSWSLYSDSNVMIYGTRYNKGTVAEKAMGNVNPIYDGRNFSNTSPAAIAIE
jgi:hypothetical protein